MVGRKGCVNRLWLWLSCVWRFGASNNANATEIQDPRQFMYQSPKLLAKPKAYVTSDCSDAVLTVIKTKCE